MAVSVLEHTDVGAAAAELAARVSTHVVEVRNRGGGAGAGIIWRPDGTIITNHHVARSDHAEVVLADGRHYQASVVLRDPRDDLAVLKVDADHLPAAPIGDARQLRVGELVLAVGHPWGIKHTVTIGVVSAMVPQDGPGQARELIRADVLLGPGNSGGPLVDAYGRVVGINAMVAGGLGLAVPSHLAERLLATRGQRPTLGISVQDVELTPALAARAPVSTNHGVLILGINPGEPAERAGLQIGDVLVALNGRALQGSNGLLDALAGLNGEVLQLSVLRGGQPVEIAIRPRPPPAQAA